MSLEWCERAHTSFVNITNPCTIARDGDPAPGNGITGILDYFAGMIERCYSYVETAKANKRPLVGIMCEFTPREVILAAGAIPICLCGGSGRTIAAAEQVLPGNVCPLIKSTFGYHLQGSNPFLEWSDLVVAETTCDGKKKMFELLGRHKPMHILELPQKSNNSDALVHWTNEVRKLKAHLEHRFGIAITDEALRKATQLMNRERCLRRQLADTMTSDTPPLTGRQLIEFKSIISGIAADLQQYETAVNLLQEARPEPEKPARRKLRVLLTGVPMVHGAERVLELIESCGAVVVAMENCTGLKPILEDVDETDPDLIASIARKYYHLPCSVMTPNPKRFETLRQLALKFRPDCVVELVWQACLTYDIESYHVRHLAEEELRLPYLKITTDYSPSDSARIIARVEALLETAAERGAR